MEKEYRAEMRIKNNLLYTCIMNYYSSIADFSIKVGVSSSLIGKYINLKDTPFNKNGKKKDSIIRIEKMLNKNVFELFPSKFLYEKLEKNFFVKEIAEDEIESLSSGNYDNIPYIEDDNYENVLKSGKLDNELSKLLTKLNPREERIIRMNFGISLPRKYNFIEIGEQINISSTRVRQIADKALRKLGQRKNIVALKQNYTEKEKEFMKKKNLDNKN